MAPSLAAADINFLFFHCRRRLVGAVTTTSSGHRLFGADEVAMGALAAQLRASIGGAAYDAAVDEGRVLDGDAAVAETRDDSGATCMAATASLA